MKRNKNRKEEIYVASAKLFRKRGYVASTMRDIAEMVGIEPSSLYSHIKSKEEILINICATCANEFDEGMQHILKSNATNPEKVLALIDLHLEIAYSKPSSVTVFNEEWRHLPPNELKMFLEKRSIYESNFKSILKAGIENDEFIAMSESTAFYIIISSVKWVHYYTNRMAKEHLELNKKEIIFFISRGLFSKMD